MTTINSVVLTDTFSHSNALLGFEDFSGGSAPGYYNENHVMPADAGRMVTLKGLKQKKPTPQQPVGPAPAPTATEAKAVTPAIPLPPRPKGAGLSGVRPDAGYHVSASGLGQNSFASLPTYMQPKPQVAPPPPAEPEGYDLSDEQLQHMFDQAMQQHMQRYTQYQR